MNHRAEGGYGTEAQGIAHWPMGQGRSCLRAHTSASSLGFGLRLGREGSGELWAGPKGVEEGLICAGV